MNWLKTLPTIAAAFLCISLQSCSNEDDNFVYPSVVTEFVDILTDAEGKATSILTDNGKPLALTKGFTNENFTESAYNRCVCIFSRDTLTGKATAYSCSKILAPEPIKSSGLKTSYRCDSLQLQSIWRGGHYVNIILNILGKDKTHYLHFVKDTLMTDNEGVHRLYIRLFHDNNSDIQAFTRKAYISLPLRSFEEEGKMKKGDSIFIQANTFKNGLETWKVAY